MSTILTQTRPFNLETTNAIPNGDVGYTKPVGLVYVTFFARSGEHEIFVFNDNQWVLHETLLQGEFKNIKMENISQFYVRCKVASGVMRISPKIDKSANAAIKQDLKYGKSLSEASNISQKRLNNTDILKASGSDLSLTPDASVSVQYSQTSVFPTINSVSLETVDSDVYLVTVNGENLTKDTQLYIYDSQIDDSVAQSLSAGYLDENDSNIGEVVDLVAYSVYPEKPEPSSFGSLEFIPEEGVVCVNANQTFGSKNPISFISSYEMKIAMKGVLGVNSYSVFAKDENGSFLHKGSFSLNITQETEELSPVGTLPEATSPELEEAYLDANGDEQSTSILQSGLLLSGMFIDEIPNSGYSRGDFTDDLRPTAYEESFSFSGFYRMNTTTANNDTATLFASRNNNRGWNLWVEQTNINNANIRLGINGTVTWKQSSYFNPEKDQFHHVAMTFQNGEMKMYHDGVEVFTQTGVSFLPNVPSDGKYHTGSGRGKGAFDQIEIFKGHVLTAEEIQTLVDQRSQKDTNYDNAIAAYTAGFQDVTSSNLEESFVDANGATQSTTMVQAGANLIDGIFVSGRPSSGYAQGTATNNIVPSAYREEFSFSGFYRLESGVANNDTATLFNCRISNKGWNIWVEQTNINNANIRIGINGTATWIQSDYFTPIKDEFNHVAMTSHDGVLKLYHNGVEVYSNVGKYFLPTNPSGQTYHTGAGRGKVSTDQIEIFKGKILSSAEIQALVDMRPAKNTAFDTAIANYIASLPTFTSLELEENFVDSNGVTTPTTEIQNGKIMSGIYVDAQRSNGHAQGTFSDNLRPLDTRQKFSFSAYYRFEDAANGNTLHPFSTWNSSRGWDIYLSKVNDTTARIVIRQDGTAHFADTGNSVTTTMGQFHHIAFTSFDGEIKIYHDGVEVYSNSNKYLLPNNPANNTYTVGNGSAKGVVDEVKVYKGTLLSQTDIDALVAENANKDVAFDAAVTNYEASLPTFTSLELEENFVDSNGVTTPTTEIQLGKLMDGIFVDAYRSNGHVQGTFSDDLRPLDVRQKFSFSAYYRFEDAANGNTLHPFSTWSSNRGWDIYLQRINSTTARIIIRKDGTSPFADTGNTVATTMGEFHHIAFTSYNGELKIYHDGVEVYSNSNKYLLPNNPTNNIYTVGGGSAKGVVDEVKVYKGTLLSQADIDALVLENANKDSAYDLAVSNYEGNLPTFSSLDLEENFVDSNGDTTPTTEIQLGKVMSGIYVDAQRSNGHVQGIFSDNLRPLDSKQRFSFSAYYRFEDAANGNTLFLFSTNNNNRGWDIYIYKVNDTTARILVRQNGTTALADTGNTVATTMQEFHHVAMTSHDGEFKIYHDGVEVYSQINKYLLPNNPTNNLYTIGGGSAKGVVDNVKVYKGTLLSQSDIDTLVAENANKDTAFDAAVANYESNLSVVNSLNLEESYVDSNGDTQDVTLSGSGALVQGVYTDASTSNGHVQGDFSDSYRPLDTKQRFSFSAYYSLETAANGQTLFLFSANNNNRGWDIYIYKVNDTTARILVRQNGTTALADTGNTVATTMQEFHHVAFTSYDGEFKIYHDGVEVYSQINKYLLPNDPTNNLYTIGGGSAMGKVDQVNIYKGTLLTASQISDMSTYESNYVDPNVDGLEDIAVMQNGATLVDGELVLNGVDQYATLADADAYDRLAGEDVTMHMWVYANSFSANNRMTLMRKGVTGPSDWDGYIIELRDTSHTNIAAGDMGIKIFSTDSNGGIEPNNTIFRPAGGISLNEWHHIAVTMKDSNDQIEVYFDGQSLGTWTAVQGLSHGNEYDLTLGGDGVSGRSLDGKMKKVTIEKSILTAEQIAALYVADAPNFEVPTADIYFDGSSTTAQIGNQTLTLQSGVSLGTGNGKYDTSFINYGASGSTNTALLNDGIDLSTGVYTFSLWFYNKRNGNDIELVLRQHVDLANPPASTNYPIVIRPTAIGGGATVAQELGVYKRIGSTNTFYGTGFSMSNYAGLSEWTHLVVVADGSNSKFYVNGQKVGNDVSAVVNVTVRQLGSYSRGYQTFAEGIDEFAYWDSALTPGQIATIYNSSEKLDVLAPPPSIPTPDLYLDGSSATPQIGNSSDVVNLGSAALVTNNGRYDSKSFNFGTSGNKAPIRLNNLDLSTGIYSVSLWFYNKRGGSDFGSILRQSGTGSNSAYYPAGTHQTTNELGLHLGAPSNTSPDYGFRSTGYDMTSFEGLQEWSHLVVVADGTNTTFYINGQQAGNVVPHVVATHLREVGAYDGNDTQVFAQALDEFAYWGSALTADHVAEIYNSSTKLGGLVTEAPASQDLEESANATLVANATVTNGILDLDGTGDYLSIPHDVAYDRESGDMSVMLWFKPRAVGYLSTLISKGTGNPSWDGWIIAVTEDDLSATDLNGNSMANGGFRFFNSAGSTNDIKYLAPTGGISLDQWHHMTLVMKSAGAYEFYYDGNLLGTFTPSSKSTTTNTELLMGANKDGGAQPAYNRMFNGMIDGVTIVKEALTSDQIAAAYNSGAPE